MSCFLLLFVRLSWIVLTHYQGLRLSSSVVSRLSWFFEVSRELRFDLIGELSIACKFIGNWIVIVALGFRVRRKVED